MLKDFLKIQSLIILILTLNVIATKNFKIPTQQEVKKSVQKTQLKKQNKKKENPMQFTFVKKNPTLSALLDLNK
ncbi:hypothetical protein [Halobacteriovorax sp. HLS]|uniref:hypothetical protein n=1 Tax=Halobacteriovorax sp. HLS TaxID=2234000 RepID=UPI000FDCD557|nr:hypothetical protein [Halobacteriovorax sp. HLS]